MVGSPHSMQWPRGVAKRLPQAEQRLPMSFLFGRDLAALLVFWGLARMALV